MVALVLRGKVLAATARHSYDGRLVLDVDGVIADCPLLSQYVSGLNFYDDSKKLHLVYTGIRLAGTEGTSLHSYSVISIHVMQ